MTNYPAKSGLHVTLFGERGAEKWVRHAYNIPPDVGCWQPYRVLVESYGCTAYTAFYTFAEFKAWLGSFRLCLQPYHGDIKANGRRAWVARFGKIEAAA